METQADFSVIQPLINISSIHAFDFLAGSRIILYYEADEKWAVSEDIGESWTLYNYDPTKIKRLVSDIRLSVVRQ